jgi:hypothetical protein
MGMKSVSHSLAINKEKKENRPALVAHADDNPSYSGGRDQEKSSIREGEGEGRKKERERREGERQEGRKEGGKEEGRKGSF